MPIFQIQVYLTLPKTVPRVGTVETTLMIKFIKRKRNYLPEIDYALLHGYVLNLILFLLYV